MTRFAIKRKPTLNLIHSSFRMMTYTPYGEEGEEDEEEKVWLASTNAVMYVVDCSADMLVKDSATGLSPLCLSLEAIRSVYCNKLIGGSKDYLAVMLCGTETECNNHSGLHVLLPLDVPDRSCVAVLEKLVKSCESGSYEFGAGKDYSPYNLLWTCNSLYNSCTKKLGIRQVMMFTNVSKPSNTDAKTAQLTLTKARDMAEIGISIMLMPLKPSNGSDFNIEDFYTSLLSDTELVAPTSDLEDLSQRVHKKEGVLRTYGEIPFILGPGLQMGIKMYHLVSLDTSKSTFIQMCAKTNEEVHSVSNQVREDTRAVLLPHEVFRKCQFGSEELMFNVEEMKEMVNLRDKGLYLLGFKPASEAVKMHQQVAKATFIRPSEDMVGGSSDIFKALLDRCIARNVVPICHCVPRAGTCGTIVALLPKEERRDADNDQLQAAGFSMIQLPFADDIRKVEVEPTLAPSDEQLQAAKKLVHKLTIKKFSPELIESPELAKFQNTLEAIALEKGAVEEIEDLTQPDTAGIDKRAGSEINHFNELIFPKNYQIPEACKKPDYRAVIAKIQNASQARTINKCSVADLKLYCKGVGLEVGSSAKKADLVTAVTKFLG